MDYALTNRLVVIAYQEAAEPREINGFPHELLMAWSCKPYREVYRAIKLAAEIGLITTKPSLKRAELTDAGYELLLQVDKEYSGSRG